jgi:hypothetical protein
VKLAGVGPKEPGAWHGSRRSGTPSKRLGAYRGGGDVGEIGGNTGSVDNIVQSQLVDEGTGLEEEGQRLMRC